MPGARSCNRRSTRARSRRRSGGRSRGAVETTPAAPAQLSVCLQANVLVLNRLYMAIHVVNVRRAFGLLFRELAEVIHVEEGRFANYSFQSWREVSELRSSLRGPHEDWIRSVNFEVQVPRVIRLLSFDRLPKRQLHLNRRSVLARDGHVCQYCGDRFPSHQLSLDHVVPRSRGGAMTWENVVCACLECNVRKGGRTPKEARMMLVRRPVRPHRNPMLVLKLSNPKYESWRTWLDGVYWDLGLRL